MQKWQCTICGYVHEGAEPPEECPVCGADKSQFVLMEEMVTEDGPQASQPDGNSAVTPEGVTQWRCTVCGYIHTGPEPPETCPVCGADKSKFVPVLEEPATAPPAREAPEDTGAQTTPAASAQRWHQIGQLLTRLHGHPIAVHIPNGLLPVSVFFTFMALFFGSEGFSVAAKYNTIVVALAMPVVIGTGWIDWVNRFGGRMTRVFMIKMICAGVVTVLSLILALWWIISADLYTHGLAGNGLFLFINLANLSAAGIAGWYGGKLVFNK